ncbi:adenylate kinase [Halorubellus sp. JP-L1]|uniref:adenylate kinase n=1 Tax=Halorubellus sp. JP-L1 TaxID=2715753 RepID=UPI00140E0EC4|nr:adenylate kinase [Halorubellus sp. JP-L1]NHN41228.1 adenylate kinase [Halorubellus sp. JP-L1]
MSDPHVLILGAPGAGKGTQSARIADEFGVEHVTTGDALRANKDMDISDMDFEYDTPREYMEAGDLVPDAVVNAIVEEALSSADGYVLDGYPRNLEQAEELEGMTELDVVLHLDVSRDELVDRLTGRRVCDDCGTNYHVEFDQPETEGVCDECGGDLVQREDDQPESVKNRLDVFDENTQPVIDHYGDHDGFVSIDGDRAPDAVWADVRDAIDAHN